MREVAVIGEDQQPFGVGVEPTNREHPRLGGHEVGDDRPSLRVGEGGHHAPRLVQQVVDETGSDCERRAVDLDAIDFDVDSATEDGDVAVDGDSAVGDQLLAGAAAAQAPLREHLLEAVAAPLGICGLGGRDRLRGR